MEALRSLPASASAAACEHPFALEKSQRHASNLWLLAAVTIIAINMAVVWLDAKASSYIPCLENCSETFHVLKYVKDYKLYGAKYGLVEDLSEDPSPSRVPRLYTHNPNLPGIVFALLEVVGVHTLAGKQFLTLLVHGLGMLYGFLAVRFLTHSAGIALIFCALMATEYELVFGFSLNALRAWHWLALFGLVFHVGHAVRAAKLNVHIAVVAIFAALGMGMGYDFFLICATISFFVAFMFAAEERSNRSGIYAGLVVAFLAPVAARQIQIISVMGLDYWGTDIYYSIVGKMSFLRGLIDVPPEQEIRQFYLTLGVYRPPPASRTLGELLAYSGDLLRYVTLPLFGLVTLVLFIGTIAGAFVVLLQRAKSFKHDLEKPHDDFALRGVFCLGIGSILGIGILADHNLTIFIKHKVPLIAAPIFLAKAVVIAALVSLCLTASGSWRRLVAGIGAVLLLSDHLAIQYFNYSTKTPYRFTWINALGANPDATYAISWDTTAVSVFTNRKTTSLSTRDEIALEQIANGQTAGGRPAILSPVLADLPDYWLYFNTDAMSPFDSFSPTCRLDYVSAALWKVVAPDTPTFNTRSAWVRPAPVRAGDYLAFGGKINNLTFRNVQLERQRPLDVRGQAVSNCKYGTFLGWIPTSERELDGSYNISMLLQGTGFPDQRIDIPYMVSAGAPLADFEHPALLLQLPMPSADEMRQRMASVPVAKSGPGWVLFDLRELARASARSH